MSPPARLVDLRLTFDGAVPDATDFLHVNFHGQSVPIRALRSRLQLFYATLNDDGQPLYNLISEQHFIHVSHVQHVDDPANVRLPAITPGVVSVHQADL
jgi:hypothetical protein